MEVLISSLVPTLPLFFLVFIAIYLLSYFYIFRDWAGVSRLEVSSCLMSLSHGTPAAVVATFAILRRRRPPFFDFAAPNTALQSMILEYSIAFFATDLLHYMLFVPTDIVYKAHHLAVLYVFVTCRCIIGYGAQPLLILLILAEVTSACRNAWRFLGLRRAESLAAFGWCSTVFYSFYTVVRGVLGPLVVYKMGVFYTSGGGDGVIPKWAWVSWMVVIGSAIVASMLWVLSRWMDFYREKCRRKEIISLS